MARTILGVELDRRRITKLVLVVIVLAGIAWLWGRLDIHDLHRRAEAIDGIWVFVLMTVLPLVGFPVAVTHAVAGVRFGLWLGWALAAVSIVLQLLASYGLVKSLPNLFARRFDALRHRLPHAAHVPLTLFTLLLPGVPYFAKNYVLPLAGVPLRTYLLWAGPIHIARSIVGIAFGDMSDDLTPARVTGFAIYGIALTATCAWAFRRLQARIQDQPPAAGGPTPRA